MKTRLMVVQPTLNFENLLLNVKCICILIYTQFYTLKAIKNNNNKNVFVWKEEVFLNVTLTYRYTIFIHKDTLQYSFTFNNRPRSCFKDNLWPEFLYVFFFFFFHKVVGIHYVWCGAFYTSLNKNIFGSGFKRKKIFYNVNLNVNTK